MKKRRKQITAAALAALAAISLTVPAYAAAGPSGKTTYINGAGAGAEDTVLDYNDIDQRIENYNTNYKQLNSTLVNSTQSLDAARELREGASDLMDEAYELRSDGLNETTRELYDSYKETAKELRKQAQKLTNEELGSSYKKTLRQTKSKLVASTQQLMIQYSETIAKQELMNKQIELAQANLDAANRMAAMGMKSVQDIQTAQETLKQAESGAAQLKYGIDNMRQNLLILTGWNHDSAPEIRPVPASDLSRIDQMNPENDLRSAIGANYDLQSIKGASASGSSARNVKKRNVAQSEQDVASTLQALYNTVISKRQSYEAALSEYAAAEQKMQAADRKYSLGMMGKLEYLSAQAEFLTSKSNKEVADIELFSAMEKYDWAVKGLIMS